MLSSMAGLWHFIRKHAVPSALMTLGFIWTLVGFFSNAYQIWTAGFAPWEVQASGAAVFMIGVVATLYQFHQSNENNLRSFVANQNLEADPPKFSPEIKMPQNLTEDEIRHTRHSASDRLPVPTSKEEPISQRHYLDPEETPVTLKQLIRGQTEIQAEHTMSPYMEKWMKVSGYILGISKIQLIRSEETHISVIISDEEGGYPISSLIFKEKNFPNYQFAKIGSIIHACGKVSGLSMGSVNFEDCELIPQ